MRPSKSTPEGLEHQSNNGRLPPTVSRRKQATNQTLQQEPPPLPLPSFTRVEDEEENNSIINNSIIRNNHHQQQLLASSSSDQQQGVVHVDRSSLNVVVNRTGLNSNNNNNKSTTINQVNNNNNIIITNREHTHLELSSTVTPHVIPPVLLKSSTSGQPKPRSVTFADPCPPVVTNSNHHEGIAISPSDDTITSPTSPTQEPSTTSTSPKPKPRSSSHIVANMIKNFNNGTVSSSPPPVRKLSVGGRPLKPLPSVSLSSSPSSLSTPLNNLSTPSPTSEKSSPSIVNTTSNHNNTSIYSTVFQQPSPTSLENVNNTQSEEEKTNPSSESILTKFNLPPLPIGIQPSSIGKLADPSSSSITNSPTSSPSLGGPKRPLPSTPTQPSSEGNNSARKVEGESLTPPQKSSSSRGFHHRKQTINSTSSPIVSELEETTKLELSGVKLDSESAASQDTKVDQEAADLERFLRTYIFDILKDTKFTNLTQVVKWMKLELFFEALISWCVINMNSKRNIQKLNRFLIQEELIKKRTEIYSFLEKKSNCQFLVKNLKRSLDMIVDNLKNGTSHSSTLMKKDMTQVIYSLMKIDEITKEIPVSAVTSISITASTPTTLQPVNPVPENNVSTYDGLDAINSLIEQSIALSTSSIIMNANARIQKAMEEDEQNETSKRAQINGKINNLITTFEKKKDLIEQKIIDKSERAVNSISETLKTTVEAGQGTIKNFIETTTIKVLEPKLEKTPEKPKINPIIRKEKVLSGYFSQPHNQTVQPPTPPRRRRDHVVVAEFAKYNFLLEFADNHISLPLISQPLVPEEIIEQPLPTPSSTENGEPESMAVNQRVVSKINAIDILSKRLRNTLLYSTVCTTALSSIGEKSLDLGTRNDLTQSINSFCDDILQSITRSISTSQQKEILSKHLKLMDPKFQKKFKILRTFVALLSRSKTFSSNQPSRPSLSFRKKKSEGITFNGQEAISILSNVLVKKVVSKRRRKTLIENDGDLSARRNRSTSVPNVNVSDIDPENVKNQAIIFLEEFLDDEIIEQTNPRVKSKVFAQMLDDPLYTYRFSEDHMLYNLVNQEREMEDQLDETEDELRTVIGLFNTPFTPLVVNTDNYSSITDTQTYVLFKYRKVLCREPKLFLFMIRSINWKGDYKTGEELLDLLIKEMKESQKHPFSPMHKLTTLHIMFLIHETVIASKIDLESVQIFSVQVLRQRKITEIETLLPQIFYIMGATKYYSHLMEFLLEACDKSEYIFNKLNWMLTSMLNSNTVRGLERNTDKKANTAYKQLHFKMIKNCAQSELGKYNLDQFIRQQKMVDNMLVISEYIKFRLGKELSTPRPQKIVQLKSLMAAQKLPYLLNLKQISMANLDNICNDDLTINPEIGQLSPRTQTEIKEVAKLIKEDSKLKFIDFIVDKEKDFHEWNSEVFPVETIPCLSIEDKFPEIKETLEISGFAPSDGYIFKSAQEPVCFPLSIRTLSNENAAEYKIIFKQGDDLRQDEYILQLFTLMNRILKQNGINLEIVTYHCVSTSQSPLNSGFVEMVSQSNAVSAILAKYKTIFNFLRETSKKEKPADKKDEIIENPDEDSSGSTTGPASEYEPVSGEIIDVLVFEEKIHKYIRSLAGYSVLTYVLAIGDRHLDNLLLKESGELFHIDFGFVLGEDPKAYLGTPPMRISREMVADFSEEHLSAFRMYCCQTFKVLRKYASLIIYMLLWISITNMDYKEQATIKRFDKLGIQGNTPHPGSIHNPLKHFTTRNVLTTQNNLRLDLLDNELDDFVLKLIDQSLNMLGPKVNEEIHKIAMKLRE
ncbi:predicted protein [Naegleria gruberi]|uniref:Predicted protein n=1 Tax=Naegleria gruberi TaxID=5762 RepID=D2W0J6_NAEGR|nr:uncharacterized protein NAEGRDRAFT_74883 [Naegleria gruberi]EFC37489.1 predicted protein [Naegleria gruberi]|eukprot:XP_002670233.1 predicted protein [Naegleria gruberi strain NEG-M]